MERLEELLPPGQVARQLNISVELVRTWMRSGRIRYVSTRLGRLIPRAEVERIAGERQRRRTGSAGKEKEVEDAGS